MRRELIFLSLLLIGSTLYAVNPRVKQRYDSETAINQEFRNVYDNFELLKLTRPHGQFSDSSTQSISNITQSQVVTFNTNDHIYKIKHSTNADTSKIYVPEDGSYFISFSAQLSMTSGAGEDMEIWLRINGVDLENSNSRSHIQNVNDERILSVAFLKELKKNDYIELVVWGTSTGCRLLAIAAAGSPTRPAIPSIILTIDKLED